MNVIKEACDRVAVIDNNTIVEVGDVLSIFSNPGTPTSRVYQRHLSARIFPKKYCTAAHQTPG
jgi:D-methionine transport system ATP-binding protein